MTDFETRSFRVPFELRMEGENQTIVGYASTFDQPYPVDMVTEIIDRSAFTRTLSEKPDVYALIGHDPSRILGRTKNGTLSLSIDERGLKCVITPVMTRDAEDTLKLIASGCIDAMSFGFKVVKQAFGYAEGKTTRRITDLELHEVSCVAFPANENATLSLRAKEMVTQFQGEQRKTYEEVMKSTKAETTKGVKVDYTVFGTAKGESKGKKLGVYPTSAKAEAMAEKFKAKGYADINIVAYEDYSKGSKKVQQDAFDEAMGGRSAGAVETRSEERLFIADSSIRRGRWVISVKLASTNKKVFQYDSEDQTEKENPNGDGWMKDADDYQGLANWLLHLNIMEKDERLITSGGSREYVATRSSSARAVETRADNSDVVKKLPQSIIHIKNEDGNIFAENITTDDVIAVMTDDYDNEQEFYESQDIKDIKDVQGFADYLVGLGLVEKGDVVMSAGKKYVVRSAPATELKTRATPATEGQQALNVENLKALADKAESLVKSARAKYMRAQADELDGAGSLYPPYGNADKFNLKEATQSALQELKEAESKAKKAFSLFTDADENLRNMLRKGKKGNRSCNAKLLELRNRIASPIDRK